MKAKTNKQVFLFILIKQQEEIELSKGSKHSFWKMKTKHTRNETDKRNLSFLFQQNKHLPHPNFESKYSYICKESQNIQNWKQKIKPNFEMRSLKRAYLAPLLKGWWQSGSSSIALASKWTQVVAPLIDN